MFTPAGKTFQLLENHDGHAAAADSAGGTMMIFSDAHDPFTATYSGPNVRWGQVIVTHTNNHWNMLYQASDQELNLSAGKARVSFSVKGDKTLMQLQWTWLTGDRSSGISKWQEITLDNAGKFSD